MTAEAAEGMVAVLAAAAAKIVVVVVETTVLVEAVVVWVVVEVMVEYQKKQLDRLKPEQYISR